MFDRSDLKAAISANILSAEQAARLEAFLLSRKADDQSPSQMGSENLRFLANFNDIFITLGLIILFVGVITLVSMIGLPEKREGNMLASIPAEIIAGGLAWLLLEYFCGRRRLLLPSMVLTLIFAGFISSVLTALMAQFIEPDPAVGVFSMYGVSSRPLWVITFVAYALAAGLVYARFRLPFSLAVIAVGVSGAVYLFLGFFGSQGWLIGGAAFFIMGLMTLCAAVFFDMQDPERIRKASDNAFWLHLAAAPQIITGVSTMMTGSNMFESFASEADHAWQGLTLLLVLISIGFVSLALNRRALIAASLITFTVTLGFVLSEAGLNASNIFTTVTILIGTGVILLGAGWRTARRAALVFFPKGGTWERIFPPEPV